MLCNSIHLQYYTHKNSLFYIDYYQSTGNENVWYRITILFLLCYPFCYYTGIFGSSYQISYQFESKFFHGNSRFINKRFIMINRIKCLETSNNISLSGIIDYNDLRSMKVWCSHVQNVSVLYVSS